MLVVFAIVFTIVCSYAVLIIFRFYFSTLTNEYHEPSVLLRSHHLARARLSRHTTSHYQMDTFSNLPRDTLPNTRGLGFVIQAVIANPRAIISTIFVVSFSITEEKHEPQFSKQATIYLNTLEEAGARHARLQCSIHASIC